MKSRLTQSCTFAAGLLASGASFAQMGPMRAPTVPQAIEMHMEQKRTLEQREAIEAKAAAAEPASVPPAPKKRTAKKAKKTQSPPAA
jgi:hypothetical protein